MGGVGWGLSEGVSETVDDRSIKEEEWGSEILVVELERELENEGR